MHKWIKNGDLYWVELTAIKNVYKLTMEDFNFMWRMVQLTNGITIIETFKSIMIFLFNIDDRTVLFHISKWFLAWANFGGTEVSFLRQKCPMGGQNCPFFLADDRSVLFTVFFGQECPFPSEISANLKNIFWPRKPPILKVEVGFFSDWKSFSQIFENLTFFSPELYFYIKKKNRRTFFDQ